MATFLQPAIAITALLLLQLFPLPTMAASFAFITDEEGEPLLNGGTYYIIPQRTADGGGLTVAQKPQTSACPLFIAQEKDGSSNGHPFKLTSPISSKYLPFGPTEFYVIDDTTTCTKPLAWRLTTDNATGHIYVAAGTTESLGPSAFSITVPFNYVQPDEYQIFHCDNVLCKLAGIFENGLLGMNHDVKLAFRFRKAFTQTSQVM
ncbi:trypsin inhibitor 1B-like [Chenopodium quinoa]|uniref:trypsin inhibitor 1B-like n=1 Tax=Chenopodium quinoa TaxID=63459 RepID=UPI000B796E24|nr:trypsin inhibitor 1B-like [Chenopodium quinoa]